MFDKVWQGTYQGCYENNWITQDEILTNEEWWDEHRYDNNRVSWHCSYETKEIGP